MTKKTALEEKLDADLKDMVRKVLAESSYPLNVKQIKNRVNESPIPYRVSSAKVLRMVKLLHQENVIEVKFQNSRSVEWGLVE